MSYYLFELYASPPNEFQAKFNGIDLETVQKKVNQFLNQPFSAYLFLIGSDVTLKQYNNGQLESTIDLHPIINITIDGKERVFTPSVDHAHEATTDGTESKVTMSKVDWEIEGFDLLDGNHDELAESLFEDEDECVCPVRLDWSKVTISELQSPLISAQECDTDMVEEGYN